MFIVAALQGMYIQVVLIFFGTLFSVVEAAVRPGVV